MNMERKTVKQKAIVIIDRIAKASELNAFTQGFDGDVIITKKLVLDKDLDISCNLHVIGGIVRKIPITEAYINIDGDFFCYGEIHCNDINVSGYFYSANFIYSKNIKVGEDFLCYDKIDVFGHDIIVAGDLKCKGVVAKEIRIFGEASIKGSISVAKAIKTGY